MQTASEAEQPYVITDYRSLRTALAARRRELGLTQLDLDAIALLTDTHTGRLECGTKRYGDVSLAATLAALGAALVLVPTEDPEVTSLRVSAGRLHAPGRGADCHDAFNPS
jgi:hypothetical protein